MRYSLGMSPLARVGLAASGFAALVASCGGEDDVASGGSGGTSGASGADAAAGVGGGAGVSGAGGMGGTGGTGTLGDASAWPDSSSPFGDAGPVGDPCAGQTDGDHCGADLGGVANHGSLYSCSGGTVANVTACQFGCASGACSQPPTDPCVDQYAGDGAYCGASLTGGDPNTLYTCAGSVTTGAETCANGCLVNPPGVADRCAPSGADPCANAASGDGAYCGGGIGGDPGTLYTCAGGSTSSSVTCANGCEMMPPGTPDRCAPGGPGDCCVERPPGTLTQAFTACGQGGSHYGIDYGAPTGTPLYAGISGTVTRVVLGFPNCYSGGCSTSCWNAFNYVKLRSDCGDPNNPGNDLYVYYLHVSAAHVSEGSHVDQGQLIADVGDSGCASGPHTHIELVSVPAGQPAFINKCPSSVSPDSRYCP